ncbi:MAG: DUF1552 domain-containing protein [Bacteroidota bacterium]
MTTDKTNRYSRRALLKGLGVGMGMLPLLNAEKVIAQTGGVAKRLVCITWTNGIVPTSFYPPAGALTAALPATLAPLEMWKSKILAIRGKGSGNAMGGIDSKTMIDDGNRFGGHSAYPSLLTGTSKGTSPSIDTLLSDSLKTQGFANPQLNLGCRPYSSSTSWRAGKVKNTAETDPYRLYTRLFAGIPAGGGGTTPPPPTTPAADPLLARRKSVIDRLVPDLTAFASKLGVDDKAKVNAHLESIRSIEKQLMATPVGGGGGGGGAGCKAPPNTPAGLTFSQVANFPNHVKLMMDIIAASVKCDISRAITLDLIDDGGGNSLTYPWLEMASPDYHAIAHNGSKDYAKKTVIDAWYYTQVANLVGQLAANPEGSATSLDNTVILVANDMNEGSNHDVTGLPFLIIGSGGGFFKQGQCIQLAANAPVNQLLASVAHAVGLQVASVGDKYPGDLDSMLKA